MSDAMNKAVHARLSSAQREEWDRLGGAEWLRKALDISIGSKYAGVSAVHELTGVLYAFAPLDQWCIANGSVSKMGDCKVNGLASAWPADAWRDVYGIDLAALFA